jgi:hypothetical protein
LPPPSGAAETNDPPNIRQQLVQGLSAILRPALAPPLPAQMFVDLLKQPFCVGEARRLVLDQLARHYRRPFADQWDFVRYARQHHPDLDLTSPPQRPARAGSDKR